jgi:hypothetical protein
VEIVILQVFVSLMLVCVSVVSFVYSVRRRDYEHADRLALLPIEEERVTEEKSHE